MIRSNGSFIGDIDAEYGEHILDEGFLSSLRCFCSENTVRTITDLGCGKGQYIYALKDVVEECYGYDGNPDIESITKGAVKNLDLSSPQTIKPTDLVMSIEVGEHIPKQYESIFIDNVTSAVGRYLVISWAIPKQPGLGHVNCQPNSYIKKEICGRGFRYLAGWTDRLRESSEKFYLKTNLQVFERDS